MNYDYIVIGSGYAGSSIASLLSKDGYSVLILESHTLIGGCASYFKRKDFVFDVGATTLSGVLKHQPLGILFDLLDLDLMSNIKKLDPGMIIKFKDKEVIRWSDKKKWISEVENKFNLPHQKSFWDEIYSLENIIWDLVKDNSTLPPKSFKDLIKLVKISNLKGIRLLPGIFLSLYHLLEKYGLNNNKDFKNFIDEQLLISTQNTSDYAPYATSTIGLTYPSEMYYPYGGIYKPAQLLIEKFKKNRGVINFKEKVIDIIKENSGYRIKTEKGNEYISKGVISSVPIWNMQNITNDFIKKYFQNVSEKFKFAWGAFTLYFAVNSSIDMKTLYYQIHTKEKVPFCNSNSFFVSFSFKDDLNKAPKGWKTVTISLHTDVNNWIGISKEEYEKRKEIVEMNILKEFDNSFPEFNNSKKEFINSGTPVTFKFFTNRKNGFVGGIPHSINTNFFSLPSSVTPFKNFYIVGDTVFPGQGIPSVTLCSLNTYYKIKKLHN